MVGWVILMRSDDGAGGGEVMSRTELLGGCGVMDTGICVVKAGRCPFWRFQVPTLPESCPSQRGLPSWALVTPTRKSSDK